MTNAEKIIYLNDLKTQFSEMTDEEVTKRVEVIGCVYNTDEEVITDEEVLFVDFVFITGLLKETFSQHQLTLFSSFLGTIIGNKEMFNTPEALTHYLMLNIEKEERDEITSEYLFGIFADNLTLGEGQPNVK